MRTRNAASFIIDKYKAAGADSIIPYSSVRFISEFVSELPERWERYNREQRIKAVREVCEIGVTKGLLKRKRVKDIKGYVYSIV